MQPDNPEYPSKSPIFTLSLFLPKVKKMAEDGPLQSCWQRGDFILE